MAKAGFEAPGDFPVHRTLQTRWGDNDAYGHVNNVIHYALADTAVNGWLIEASQVDVRELPALGVVAETGCRYFRELSFPAVVDVGIGLEHRGRTSVVYRLGLFEAEEPRRPYAFVRFVHVYVDPDTRRPVAIPEPIARALRQLA
ncbi:MAG TPA: thioesterase family protein [Acidimicrobiia bacterium]|nr:thioesterase family protein [Acidimicrobiia bacterium]